MVNLVHPSFESRPERIVGREDVIAQFVSGLEREPGHRDRATLTLDWHLLLTLPMDKSR